MERTLRTSLGQGAVMLTMNDFTSEIVWQASIGPMEVSSINRDCPYSVGIGGTLNTSVNAAPVISIATGEYFLMQ